MSAFDCPSRSAHGWPRRREFFVTGFAVGMLLVTADVSWSTQSYQYLSRPAKAFIDGLDGVGDNDGQLDDATNYNALKQSERTTYEAIMHALGAQGLFDIVTSVTAIWGGIPRSTQGQDQFRISVCLAEGTPARLGDNGYLLNANGPHVKLPNGRRLVGGQHAATARQSGGYPSMQISWLKEDPTVGEIDIDYVPVGWRAFLGFGHASPGNSDVRDDLQGSPPHYDEHIRRYGLERWWDR